MQQRAWKKWSTVSLFFVLLLMSLALFSLEAAAEHRNVIASDVTLEARPIKDKVLPGEWLEYDLTIRNNKIADDVFRMKIEEENTAWSVLVKPLPVTNMIILGRHSKTVRLLLKDLNLRRDAKRPYGINIMLESLRTGHIYNIQLSAFLLPGELDVSRLPVNITVSMTAPTRIDPRNRYSVKVNLVNGNRKPYKDLSVFVQSKLVKQESIVDLAGGEAKSVDFTLVFDEDQPPMHDVLSFYLMRNSTLLASGQVPIEIVSYRIPFNQTVLVTEKFLQRTEELTVRNEENVREQQAVRVSMPFFKRLVSKANPPAAVERVDGRPYYTWTVNLNPREKIYITVTTNYRIYLYLAVLLGLAVFVYYMFKNPVSIIKQAEKIKTMEGGIAEMKVVLSIRNMSNKDFQCQLQERLPHMVDYLKREEHGSLPPDKVIRTKHGTVLRWLFDLEAKEERIVMYHLKTKLHVLGGLRIPPAVMKIKYGDMHVTVESNELDVTTE